MYLLRALIGSLDCLRLLWLVRVITLVLVLRHSNENRSNHNSKIVWLPLLTVWLAPRVNKMKRVLCSDWLLELERWAYLARSGLPLCSRNLGVIFWPYNKPFIDQACSLRMVGYWPRSFLCVFMDLDFVLVQKNAKKKELGQYSAILTSRLVNNSYIFALVLMRICTLECRVE